jgi:small subunit ribosomal protein S8
MSLTDPMANALTKIRNALKAKKETVDIPFSKLTQGILALLKEKGYIRNFKLMKDNKQGILKVYLRYTPTRQSAISGLKRISRPGLRIYVGRNEIHRVRGGLGFAILTTSRGVMTDKEAKESKVGGEVLCYVW